MKKQQIVVSTIVAAAAGLVAGLLTAPKSGKETRADIKKRAEEMRDSASDKAGEVSKNIKDKFVSDDE